MAIKIRKVFQLFFLAAFIGLFALGKIQMWMVIFLASIIAAILFGRFYCGWICPANTLMEGIGWIYKKLGIKPTKTPGWLKTPVVRYGVLALFLAAMVFVQVSGRK